MEWAKKHPRLHAIGGVAMLVGGVLSSISGAWQLCSNEPLISFLARLTLPSFSTKIAVLIVGISVAIVGGILLRRVFKATKQPTSQPMVMPSVQSETPNRREALGSAKVAWGLWHTGHRNRIDKLLGLESLSRILVLNPNANSDDISAVARRSGETIENLVTQIWDTTRDTLKHGKQIRWYPQHRESSFTIVDITPIEEGGILKPCSANAWMYVEYLNPDVGVDQRQGGPIYNKGKQKSLFMGFYKEYEDIWENRSVPANLTEIEGHISEPVLTITNIATSNYGRVGKSWGLIIQNTGANVATGCIGQLRMIDFADPIGMHLTNWPVNQPLQWESMPVGSNRSIDLHAFSKEVLQIANYDIKTQTRRNELHLAYYLSEEFREQHYLPMHNYPGGNNYLITICVSSNNRATIYAVCYMANRPLGTHVFLLEVSDNEPSLDDCHQMLASHKAEIEKQLAVYKMQH